MTTEESRTTADRIIARLAKDPRPRELYPSEEALRAGFRANPFASEQEIWTWAQGYDSGRASWEAS